MDLDFDISDLEDDLDLTHVDIELKIVSSCSPRYLQQRGHGIEKVIVFFLFFNSPKKKPRTQNAGNDMTMKTRVEFTYETNIKLTGLEVGPKQLEYNETIVAFAHTFKITNEGPSPLNKDLHYTLYVPDSGLLDVVLVMQFKVIYSK